MARLPVVLGSDGGWRTQFGPVCGELFNAGYGGKGNPSPCTRVPLHDGIHWTSAGAVRVDEHGVELYV